ncbi:hypothetical protein [Staphylococcus pseudintermedius]|uniref:hypothetical protein n=1 Tax=Staphylococcus pseudintermedius TaxID=283734 RepID=UPI001F2C77D8|nr:hypothetical protein [Staphylococcus pseudintermedius]
MKMKSEIQLVEVNNEFVFVDSIDSDLMNRKVQRTLKKFASYFSDFTNHVLKSDLSHLEIERLVSDLNKALTKVSKPEILIDNNIKNLLMKMLMQLMNKKLLV